MWNEEEILSRNSDQPKILERVLACIAQPSNCCA